MNESLISDSRDISEIEGVMSLAKLLHGIGASASILFGQVASGSLKLTSLPHANTCPR